MILLLNQQIEDLANEQTAVRVLVMVFGIVIMDEFEQIPVFAGVFPFFGNPEIPDALLLEKFVFSDVIR